MQARWYAPEIQRFISADTIVPDPTNPQSLNRFAYVRNNPVNLVDPTGHAECGPTEVLECHGETSTPDGWVDNEPNWHGARRIFVDGYGIFDIEHIERGYRSAKWIIEHLKLGELFPNASDEFIINYQAADSVANNQLANIALGIYMDFELAYEAYQASGDRGFIQRFGGFAPEDLPSDYLGFWAYANGYSWEDIPAIVNTLGSVSQWHGLESILGNQGGSLVVSVEYLHHPDLVLKWSVDIPRNSSFTPMAPKFAKALGGWTNVPWPEGLQMTPIESGPTSWWIVQ